MKATTIAGRLRVLREEILDLENADITEMTFEDELAIEGIIVSLQEDVGRLRGKFRAG
jgi:hypothetical protein